MAQALDFVKGLYTEFSELESLLQKVLKDEGSLENSVLIKKGFLIRRYSIREDKIDIGLLRQIRAELRTCLSIELRIKSQVDLAKSVILSIEKDYNAYQGGNVSFWRIFQQVMKNAFRMSRLAVVRFDELISILGESAKLVRTPGSRVEMLIISTEKMITQVMKFIDLLRQIDAKLSGLEDSYFPSPRMYGRAMSKKEAKATISGSELIGSPKRGEADLIAVFDCSSGIKRRIVSMNNNERRNFFGRIGVAGVIEILFFRTRLKPKVGPVPQKNGLQELKFPKGIHVDVLEAA